MNARGRYGTNWHSRTYVGASLVHTLELKQRYDNVNTAAAASLLSQLSQGGKASAIGENRWDIALKDGAWVRLVWYPDWRALEVTVSDRELRRVEEMETVRRHYETILDKITPMLRTRGATTVGAATYAGQQAQAQPRFAARTRAVRAVFDMYTHARAPYYIYAEVNGLVDKRSASTVDEANAIFAALEKAPGEVYVAIFDPTDVLWPGPAFDVYHAAAQVPQDRPVVGRGQYGLPSVGITLYHSVGDRADAVRQMAIDWSALYQNLATQVGEIPADPREQDFSRTPALQQAREEEIAAWNLADTLPIEQRPAARKRAQDLTERRGQLWFASFDPKKIAWWKSYAKPLFNQWTRFKLDQLGGDRTVAADYIAFAERFQTNWDVYESWKKKLDNLRAEAQKRGFTVEAPKPTELPTTVWADVATTVEKGAGKVASGIGDVWNILKYGAWAVLGIGAVVAISSVASNLRRGKDPAEKYVELIRESRRSRSPRALPPARAQLALPPGRETEGA